MSLIKERRKAIIREESSRLMQEIPKLDAEWKRAEVLKGLDAFYKYPLEEMRKFRDAERKKYFDKGMDMAMRFLSQAKADTNPATQEIKIRAAKKLIMYPITALRRMANKYKTDVFISEVPERCRPAVQGVFADSLSNILIPDFNRIDDKVKARIQLYSQGEDWKDAPQHMDPMPNPNRLQGLAVVSSSRIPRSRLVDIEMARSMAASFSSLSEESSSRLSMDTDNLEEELPSLNI